MYRGVSVNVGLMAAMKSNHQILGNFELTISVPQLNVHTQTHRHTHTNKNTHTQTHTNTHTLTYHEYHPSLRLQMYFINSI